MAHEFEKLALDGHNYSTWVLDVKISLTFTGMYEAIVPPADR
jgi:hypothetical protein